MTKPVKMIEIFSGIGAQAKALDNLPIPHEVVATMDVDKEAIVSYAAMRYDLDKEIENYNFPSKKDMVSELQQKNVGFDFQKSKHTITMKTNENKVKQYYIADKLSKNLGDVSLQKELPYVDVIFHSSPCQSFSQAGKGEGGDEGSGTTSSLMWESLRLIGTSMPRFIVWENVAAVLSGKHRHNFIKYLERLSEMGYESAFELLNSKNYGVPQNRLRIFCVSRKIKNEENRSTTIKECKSPNKQVISTMKEIREKHPNIKIWEDFTFPEPIPLTTRLKDILEHNVDEKYYLPDNRIEKILNSSFMQEKKRIQTTDVCDTLLARDWKDPKCVPIEEDVNPIRIGNIYDEKFGTGYAGNVWDKDGISPTLQTAQGGNRMPLVIEEKEPFIVASRGRNPENPSDRTTGAPTEQRLEPNFSGTTNCLTSVQKDNYVCEPQVIIGSMQKNAYVGDASISPSLTAAMGMGGGQIPMVGFTEPQVLRAERTEYGKAIRKQYEAGEIDEKIGNMREMKPRTDGVSNTITTLLKDNYVAEPIVEKVAIVEDQFPGSRDARIYKEYSPTLRQNCGGLQVAKGEDNFEPQLEFVGGIGDKDWAKDGKQLSRNYPQGSRVYCSDGIASALTAQGVGGAGGFSGLYTVYEEQPKIRWRIRKLTPVECWRLMNFTDQDCNRAAKYVSASALYKQAGNSIVVACLIAIFSSLFAEDGYKSDVWTKYSLKYDD